MSEETAYLRAILSTVARRSFPPAELARLVLSHSNGKKQLQAYNMCDGSRPQSEIAKAVGLDKGSLSRTISRWIDLGIVIRVGEGGESRPVHLYPLAAEHVRDKKGKKNG